MRRLWVVGGAVAVVGAWLAACGIDESGLAPADGAADVHAGDSPAPPDAPTDVVLDVPQGCATLDATACLDAGLPDGWSYVGIAEVQTTCPSGGYAASQYVDDLSLAPGACACGMCVPSGRYTCARTLTYSNGKVMGTSCAVQAATFDGGDEAGCFDTSGLGPDNHVEVDLTPIPPTSVNAGCDASVVGSRAYDAGAVTACTPTSCSADYCNLPPPFRRCIFSTTPKSCPAPFVPAPAVGPSSEVDVSCSACTCRPAPTGGCAPTLEAWATSSCSGGGSDLGAVTPNACNDTGGGTVANGLFYDPGTPAANCANTDGGTGTVGFKAALTVCCLP